MIHLLPDDLIKHTINIGEFDIDDILNLSLVSKQFNDIINNDNNCNNICKKKMFTIIIKL